MISSILHGDNYKYVALCMPKGRNRHPILLFKIKQNSIKYLSDAYDMNINVGAKFQIFSRKSESFYHTPALLEIEKIANHAFVQVVIIGRVAVCNIAIRSNLNCHNHKIELW